MLRTTLMFILVAAFAPAVFAQTQPGANSNSQPAMPARPQNNNTATAAGQMMQNTNGSLLKATLSTPADPNQAKLSSVSFFAVPEPEPRTLKKHDLVTIIIREESSISSDGSTELKREGDVNAAVNEWVGLDFSNFELESGAIGNAPQISMVGTRNFKGEGTVDRTDVFVARITAEILDVKPNGTLVLQARKKIKTDDEVQEFTLTGICRAIDIAADNTVLSTQMYDFALEKNHQGAVRDSTKRGWVNRILDFLNPF